MTLTTTEAAELLGMKPDEIRATMTVPPGDLIVTVDGTSILVVPDDQPDANGQTGIMLAAPPSENYQGAFPVYAPTADTEERVREVSPPSISETPDTERSVDVDDAPVDLRAAPPVDVEELVPALAAPVEISDEPAPAPVIGIPAVASDEPPAGTSTEVLDWVGFDAGRAALALAAEHKASRPRSRLISSLETLARQDRD